GESGTGLRGLDRPAKNSPLVRTRRRKIRDHARGHRSARWRPLSCAIHRFSRGVFRGRGIYREVIPNERLVFSWAWHSTPERESLVTVTFKPEGDGTLLTVHHSQLFDEAARAGHQRGWLGALDKLEGCLAIQGPADQPTERR